MVSYTKCFPFYHITLIAETTEEPFANSAAIDEAKLQPVPWVFEVFIRLHWNSKKSLPARSHHKQIM